MFLKYLRQDEENGIFSVPFGTVISVPLSDILKPGWSLTVDYNGDRRILDKLNLVFAGAETLEETIFVQNLLDDVCNHKKFMGLSLDRGQQNLPFELEYFPEGHQLPGGWLVDGEAFNVHQQMDFKDGFIRTIFHPAVIEHALDSGMKVCQVKIEFSDKPLDVIEGYYYTLYAYKNKRAYPVIVSASINNTDLFRAINRFLKEPDMDFINFQ